MKRTLITLLGSLSLLHGSPTEREQGKLLEQRVFAVYSPLARGDFSSVDAAAKSRDLGFLWGVYAKTGQIGWGNTDAEFKALGRTKEEVLVFQQRLRAYVAERLTAIPGHAKWLGDRIESASTDPERENVRQSSFNLLGSLATSECIHELGRFLFDRRQSKELPWSQIPRDGIIPSPNYMHAAQEMDRALGENSPWKPFRENGWVNPTSELMELMQDWWLSEASLPYRQGSPYLLPPPGTRAPQQPAPKPRPLVPPASKETLSNDSAEVEWPLLLAVGAVLACLLWLYTRKNRLKDARPAVTK